MAHAIADDGGDRTRFVAGVGLAAFAISLPIVRLLVDAPEFLIAHGLSRWAAVAFFVVVVVVVPLAIGVVLALLGRFLPPARTAAIGVLGVVAFAGVLQPISSSSAIFVLGALAGGIVLALAEARRPAVRSVLASLAVLSLLLAAWVVGPSRVGAYVRSGGDDPSAPARDVTAPVVVLAFDEVSMIPMLEADLAINDERYPNLAALARTSHWFRRASSVSPQTSASVPALLSGQSPDLRKVPVAAAYPTSIFAELGGSMDVLAHEPITALCPSGQCAPGRRGGASVSTLASDTWLVLRHAVSSEGMRASLPSIEQGWAGFDAAGADDVDADAAPTGGYGTFPVQVDELAALASGRPGGEPDLIVGHFIAPHLPWISLHDGTTYDGGQPAGMTSDGGTLAWTGSEAERRLGYQRYALQVGALDRAIGRARAELEDAGVWDDAIVVVTADHGVQFEPGGIRAVGPGGAEVTNVPLFIKAPNQTEGVVEDAPALTIDILPTVLGLLGLDPTAELDGVDLLGGDVPATRTGAFLVGEGDAITPDQRDDAIAAAVERRARWIDPSAGWDAAYQPGLPTPLIGTPVDARASTATGGSWSRPAGETGPMVSFSLRAAVAPSAVLAVCDGTIAGAAPASAVDEVGAVLTSPDHCDDPDAAELWLLDAQGRAHPTERTT